MRFIRSKLGFGILLAIMCILFTASPVLALPKLTSSTCPSIIKEGQSGNCVKELQTLLNKHGAKLSVDGDFGPLTLKAVEKFQKSAGLDVDGLVGPKTKSALNKSGNLRTTKPSKTKAPKSKSKVVSVAVAEIGTLEGSSRSIKYGSACGLGGQSTNSYHWCACFVSWVTKKVGATSYHSAKVQYWVNAARAKSHGLSIVSNPKPGDLVAFDWGSNGDYNHIGIVRSVSGDTFTTVEGNTGNPNGGKDGVFKKTHNRNYNNVRFIRMN